MKLITDTQMSKLQANHKAMQSDGGASIKDKKVVVKLFNPNGIGRWWLYSMDDNGNCFGVGELEYKEYGYVNIHEIQELRTPMGLKIERDQYPTEQTFGEVL
tara:strand:+ start:1258 stop:1563 length:306 start_codon:yes stop_codon:yes gene_type:complete